MGAVRRYRRVQRTGTGGGFPAREYPDGMEIWINPRCSKCRTAIGELDAAGAEYTVRRYLEEPPSTVELEDVLERLSLEPWDITRLDEQAAKDLGMKEWGREPADRSRWITALAEHPILIQRPIITADDGHAVVARTPEALKAIVPTLP
ncbi:arsenate reductase family protein [Kitasatospora cinereorecta]